MLNDLFTIIFSFEYFKRVMVFIILAVITRIITRGIMFKLYGSEDNKEVKEVLGIFIFFIVILCAHFINRTFHLIELFIF